MSCMWSQVDKCQISKNASKHFKSEIGLVYHCKCKWSTYSQPRRTLLSCSPCSLRTIEASNGNNSKLRPVFSIRVVCPANWNISSSQTRLTNRDTSTTKTSQMRSSRSSMWWIWSIIGSKNYKRVSSNWDSNPSSSKRWFRRNRYSSGPVKWLLRWVWDSALGLSRKLMRMAMRVAKSSPRLAQIQVPGIAVWGEDAAECQI